MSAVEQNEQDRVYEDMQVLEDTCKLNDFQFMLLIPSLQPGQKCKVVGSVFDKHLSKLSMSMIELVIRNKRETFLPMIARNYREFYRKEKGIRSAKLVTALEVDAKAMDSIEKLIAGAYESGVELSATVNKEVIGGFVLTVEGLQYDASVATSLRKMKKELLQTSIEK